MAKVGNQGLGDKYVHLQSNRISHPVVSELRQSHLITFSTIFQHLISVYKEVMAKTKTLNLMNLNNLKGKVNNIVQLICAFKYFFLVEIVDPCVYLFSVNCFTREDAYSTLSPFAYERQPRL